MTKGNLTTSFVLERGGSGRRPRVRCRRRLLVLVEHIGALLLLFVLGEHRRLGAVVAARVAFSGVAGGVATRKVRRGGPKRGEKKLEQV